VAVVGAAAFDGKVVTMRINENDIIDEIEAHIRRCGGELGEWRVGTAKD
jgi:hypothetical protein